MEKAPWKTDPFRPPKRSLYNHLLFGFFGPMNRWIYEDFLENRVVFLFCVVVPPCQLLLLARYVWIQMNRKPLERWTASLVEERQAVAFDEVIYLGGHPLAPMPEEAALFLRDTDIHLEFRSGRELDISLGSVGAPEVFTREKSGIFITDQIAGMFVTSEIFHRTEYFLQLPFRDDKGFDNVIRFACGKFVPPDILANLVISGRYHAATPVVQRDDLLPGN